MAVIQIESSPQIQQKWEQWRAREPSGILLDPDPFLTSLASDAPLWDPNALPDQIVVPALKPHLDRIYGQIAEATRGNIHRASGRSDGKVVYARFGAQAGSMATEARQGGVLLGGGDNERGINVHRNPATGKNYASQVFSGTPHGISQLLTDLDNIIGTGNDPVSTNHSHPAKLHLPFPSSSDLAYAFLEMARPDGSPAVKELNILGDGIQVKSVRTQATHATIAAQDVERFITAWDGHINSATNKDVAIARMAESVGVTMYYSLDREHWTKSTPGEIFEVLRQMDAYNHRKAA